ncbi:MAG TPA: prolyl oligopeptidase family serine peptidase [Candidatus Angelobacter sp.]|jgi:dipeptidyl aminopeptidase/acylaminoacyl peptidase|nr:prolyl oligopeptidase family serine peptidase [Candidatus Angelobacter sp.]
MRKLVRHAAAVVFTLVAIQPWQFAQAQQADKPTLHGYQKAPQPISDILNARPTPLVQLSPNGKWLLAADRLANPPVADLAQPMLRIAGLRINPATNGRHHPPRLIALSLVEIATGNTRNVTGLPGNPYLSLPDWSPDGTKFAFTNTVADGIELWIGNVETAKVEKLEGFKISAIMGDPVQWMPDGKALLVQTVPATRGNPPAEPKMPDGPIIQESDGKKAPVRTYEDLLENAHDEDLFDYYAAAQLTRVSFPHVGHLGPIRASIDVNGASRIGKPGIFSRVEPSPDGKHLLVSRIHRPYSYIMPESDFPREVEIWDLTGKLEHKVASLPLADHVPIEGVLTGPRDYQWVPTQPATLVWAEALDGGDPKTKAEFRDKLMLLRTPFSDQPQELARFEQRFVPAGGAFGAGRGTAIEWTENGLGLARDYNRDRRWQRTFLLDIAQPGAQPTLIWERSIRDRYRDPGTPLTRTLPNGKRILRQQGNAIFLVGAGASPKGEFPFLDRFDLMTRKAERIFQCQEGHYEAPVSLLSDDGSRFLTRHESPTEPPNYFIRTAGSADKKALTNFPDPAPQLHGITKQLVTYKRADGVQLSFTLYLPANYKQGERLPTIVWAYPLEFNDADTAGQVSGSPYHFTTISGISQLFLVTQGYAVLDNATMPVVGDPETMNNTYVEQIVASAKAAIDKAVEMGVTDRERVGVGGHSYGAFMTANLLAHSDLFRAGVARSGAYNRTLTPFGFQSERRTIWEAPEMYIKVSPFMHADKIKHPILLIHGMADDNSGTFPIQSERMYQAIKGNGGIVRYVQLPYEAHGYLGRESTEHTLWEMVTWFDKWVKNAPPEQTKTATGGAQH